MVGGLDKLTHLKQSKVFKKPFPLVSNTHNKIMDQYFIIFDL